MCFQLDLLELFRTHAVHLRPCSLYVICIHGTMVSKNPASLSQLDAGMTVTQQQPNSTQYSLQA